MAIDPTHDVPWADDSVSGACGAASEASSPSTDLAPLASRVPDPPALRFPHELLSVIFLLCLPLYREREENRYAFSQVCRYWRAVALRNPILWNDIRLKLDDVKDFEAAIDLVRTHIERSGSTLLNIHVYNSTKVKTDPIFDILMPHAQRWESIFMRLSAEECKKIQSVKGQLLALKYLQIALTDILPFDLDVFEDAPALQHVAFHFPTQVERLKFNWGNLSTLEFSWIRIDTVLEILARCPRVECCKFQGIAGPRDDHVLQRTTVPRVHTAIFTMVFGDFQNGFTLDFLFTLLNFPALKTLEVATHWISPAMNQGWLVDGWPHDFFLDMLTRSKCNLERLSFSEVVIGAANLILYLQGQPSIRYLRVIEMYDDRFPNELYSATVSDELTRALTVIPAYWPTGQQHAGDATATPGEGMEVEAGGGQDDPTGDANEPVNNDGQPETAVLLPLLENLYLGSVETDLWDTDIIEMIKSRWWRAGSPDTRADVTRLRAVAVDGLVVSEAAMNAFHAFEQEGLKIDINHGWETWQAWPY